MASKTEVKVVLLMDAIAGCLGSPTSVTWYSRELIARGLIKAGWRPPVSLKKLIKKASEG